MFFNRHDFKRKDWDIHPDCVPQLMYTVETMKMKCFTRAVTF